MTDAHRSDGDRLITHDELKRATDALVPFVMRWGLPLNPEHLEEMAYAVLVHYDGVAVPSAPNGWAALENAVHTQIDEFEARNDLPPTR